MMQDWFARRLKLLREEARACLHLAKLTALEAERVSLRRQAARLAMQAELEERQRKAGRISVAATRFGPPPMSRMPASERLL